MFENKRSVVKRFGPYAASMNKAFVALFIRSALVLALVAHIVTLMRKYLNTPIP